MFRKLKGYGFLALIASPMFLIGGISMSTADEVTCDGEVMTETDFCETTQYGETTYTNYEEQRKDNQGTAVFCFVAAGVAGVLGTITLVITLRQRKAGPAAPQPVHPGQHPGFPQPGHPQQVQYPQQPGFPPQQAPQQQWQPQQQAPPPGYPPQQY